MSTVTTGVAAARQAHSLRCRQRVVTALDQAAAAGAEISISAIARHAGVDRLGTETASPSRVRHRHPGPSWPTAASR